MALHRIGVRSPSRFDRFLTGEVRNWLAWREGLVLAGLIVVLLLLAVLCAYQPRFESYDRITDHPNHIRLTGIYPSEGQGENKQRWTSRRTTLRYVGVGEGTYSLKLRFHGGAESGAGRTLDVSARNRSLPLANLVIRPDWQELLLAIPAEAIDTQSGDLSITLEIEPMKGAADDPRELGVALTHATLQPISDGDQLRLPPLQRTRELLVSALAIYLALWLLFTPRRLAATIAISFGLLISVGIAFARLDTILLLTIAQRVLPWTLLIALILRALSSIAEYGLHAPRWLARPPAAVFAALLFIFAIRYGGLLHPQYIMIDQRLRANQLLNIAAGRADLVRPQLEQQYEWGTREPVPYSLITYDMLVPLTWWYSNDDLVKAIAATSSLIDATVPLMLWGLVVQGSHRRRKQDWSDSPDRLIASFAALLYAGMPLGYLFFHDGSFPTTIGVWFVVLMLLCLRWLVEAGTHRSEHVVEWRAGFWVPMLFCCLAAGLALTSYVTHLAFVPFLLGSCAASLWLLAKERAAAWRIGLSLLIAGIGSWLIYYRDYTLILIQRTIPAFIEQIATQGSVGRDTELLYATAVNTPFEHLYAHFRIWPILLGLIALALLLRKAPKQFITHIGLSYALFLLATTIAEQWFGLWNKHMTFALPGIALLAGAGMAYLWQKGRLAQLICTILLAYLFWESTLAWGNRVLWYSLPAHAM